MFLPLFAQDVVYPYLIENEADGRIVRRGTADGRGIPNPTLILGPNGRFRLHLLDTERLLIGSVVFTTPANGQTFTIPPVTFHLPTTRDSDGDGLHDEAEYILGTNGADPDTDGDGLWDGAEVAQGLDPLDGLVLQTGIIAATDTPGTARGVYAFNDMVLVADDDRGLSIFNIYNGMNPLLIARLGLPLDVHTVHGAGDLVALLGADGLVVVSVADPAQPALVRTVTTTAGLGAAPQDVAVADGIGYLALADGRLLAVDLLIGVVLEEVVTGEARLDGVGLSGDRLIVLGDTRLLRYDLGAGLEPRGAVMVSGAPASGETGRKLFAGGNRAYVGADLGFSIVDIANPAGPVVLGTPLIVQAAVHDLFVDGSGLLTAVTRFAGGAAEVSIFDVADPTVVDNLVTAYPVPGEARAAALYNGLAYVAAGLEGLQILSYRPFDTQGVPPTVTLLSAAVSVDGVWQTDENQPFRIAAQAADDVQVRHVVFLVDGVPVAVDGAFPFEYRFTAPPLGPRTGFSIAVRVSDTGGNSTLSETRDIQLVPDTTPPVLARVSPFSNALLREAFALSITWSEPMQSEGIDAGTWTLTEAGPDAVHGTADDVPVPGGTIAYRQGVHVSVRDYPAGLATGRYLARMSAGPADLAGNTLAAPYAWTFRIDPTAGQDTDGDGLPDEVEDALGLDPENPDTDGDGTPDGEEDSDGDGLTNLQEVAAGTNPGNPDSDGDGLSDLEELGLCTSAADADSDDDGFDDGTEVAAGSDPCDGAVFPPILGEPYAMAGLSVLNLQVPAAEAFPGVTASGFSVLNLAWPGSDGPLAYGQGTGVFSVLNLGLPAVAAYPSRAEGPAFSVLNLADPAIPASFGLGIGPAFSVENTGGLRGDGKLKLIRTVRQRSEQP